MTTLELPRLELPRARGAANRAVVRWSIRLFRREWRQQALVVGLIAVAVTASILGVALAANATVSQMAAFGRANAIFSLQPGHSRIADDLAAARNAFGAAEVISHTKVSPPAAVNPLDVRDQVPDGPLGAPMLRLDTGRYPLEEGEVALTDGAAALFDVTVGGPVMVAGQTRTVVGIVENPSQLSDEFVLVAPGSLAASGAAEQIDLLVRASHSAMVDFQLPDGSARTTRSIDPVAASAAAAIVLAMATVGLLFVGLLSVAGFAVMAQRRRRALGMLEAVGATDRQVRLVLLAGGAVTGIIGAGLGTGAGLGLWLALAGRLEPLLDHRIARFDLPWWAVPATMALAVATAVGAAWWPAKAAARTSVVAALSGRPPAPRPAHRFAALGVVALVSGAALLFVSQQRTGWAIVGGSAATVLGVLLLAPLAVRSLGLIAGRLPVAARLATRDLVRYRARSGAAVGAAALALGLAATISVSAAASGARDRASGILGNLPANELVVYAGSPDAGPVPVLTDEALGEARNAIARIVDDTASTSVELDAAIDPSSPTVSLGSVTGHPPASLAQADDLDGQRGYRWVAPLYVATPEVLRFAGIDAAAVGGSTDVLTPRHDVATTQIFLPRFRQPGAGDGGGATGGTGAPDGTPPAYDPAFHSVDLAVYTSEPTTLLTPAALDRLGLQATPVAWAIRSPHAFTEAELADARRAVAAAGLSIESQRPGPDYARVRTIGTLVGVLVALGVLAMTVGLIRSETEGDVRTLAAAGASGRTRRMIVGVTAGLLGLLGGVLGLVGAYSALLAWNRSDLVPLGAIPWAELATILVGLPVVACILGWLLAGREPPSLGRAPLS